MRSTFTETEVVALKNRTTFCDRIYCLQVTYTCNFVLTLHKFFLERRSTYSEQQCIKWSPAYRRLNIMGNNKNILPKSGQSRLRDVLTDWELTGTKRFSRRVVAYEILRRVVEHRGLTVCWIEFEGKLFSNFVWFLFQLILSAFFVPRLFSPFCLLWKYTLAPLTLAHWLFIIMVLGTLMVTVIW